MSIAALIRNMSAAGATPEAIAIAVDAIEAAQAQVESQRAVARDRKRRQRAKERGEDGTVTGQSRDSHGTVTENPTPSPSPNENLNPNPTPTRESITPAREAAPDLPVGASAEQWAGFVEMRRRIRKPLTARAQQLALRKLSILAENGQPPGAVLDQSTLNGWQDLFPLKDPRNGHRNSNNPGPRSNDGFLDALREVGGR